MCKEGLGKAKSICLCGTCLCAFNHVYGSNGNWQPCSGFQMVATNIAGTFCISYIIFTNSRFDLQPPSEVNVRGVLHFDAL